MDIEITITRSENGARGRYTARVAGEKDAGELTYTRAGEDTLIADHTGVPKALRKRGIATALVERLVADAREEGLRIVPSCPFVRAWFGRNPESSDLMAGRAPGEAPDAL